MKKEMSQDCVFKDPYFAGGPDQNGTLPTDHAERKATPIYRGVMRYFPRALAEVSRVSAAGSRQHHPDKEMHWDKSKSSDHGDCVARHLIDAGTLDTDGVRHSAKMAWRALALLEIELENEVK